MTLTATDFGNQHGHGGTSVPQGPSIEQSHWGYSVRDGGANGVARVLGAAASRFAGTIMLLIAAGLLLVPDAAQGAGVDAMKLAAMVVFSGIGLFLFFFGRQASHPELHVDTTRGEIRVGRRGLNGGFRQSTSLPFEAVASVYLLRSKDRSRPARLFLRLAGSDAGLEVSCGPEAVLETLRGRLTRDLAQDPRNPVEIQLRRHAGLAA